jgi:aspartate/methionine/tyrosine aminotransferase
LARRNHCAKFSRLNPLVRDLVLEIYFSRWRSAARHQLTSSDSETLSLAELLGTADAEDLRRWETLELGYTDPRGTLWLRETIAGGYESVTAESVLCFAGAQEGIYAAMHALLGADDHAVVVTPNYQSTETIPLALCAVTGVALDPARGWTLDIDAVAAATRPNTRLISVNFPNNPTGKILERDRGISLGSVSKSYGLPGLRVGWIACRDLGLLRRMERVKHYLSNCVAAPSELLAQIAMKAGDRIVARNRLIAERNLALLNTFFAEHDDLFDWHVPDGGVVGYPRYDGAEGVENFCGRLVQEQGVLLLPASIFQSDVSPAPQDRFRIGFGRGDLAAALAAMKSGLPQASPSKRWAV